MTVDWRHRIIRVAKGDLDAQHEALLRAVGEGWIFDAQELGEGGTVDLVFRRARPQAPRMAWS